SGAVSVVPGKATALVVAPSTLSLSADAGPATFSATGTDHAGNPTADLGSLTWSVASGPITAIAPSTGAFTPTLAGTGTVGVHSSYGPSAASGAVTVTAGKAAALVVSPNTLSINADAAPTPFSATGTDHAG